MLELAALATVLTTVIVPLTNALQTAGAERHRKQMSIN